MLDSLCTRSPPSVIAIYGNEMQPWLKLRLLCGSCQMEDSILRALTTLRGENLASVCRALLTGFGLEKIRELGETDGVLSFSGVVTRESPDKFFSNEERYLCAFLKRDWSAASSAAIAALALRKRATHAVVVLFDKIRAQDLAEFHARNAAQGVQSILFSDILAATLVSDYALPQLLSSSNAQDEDHNPLECPICMLAFRDPMTLECGHRYSIASCHRLFTVCCCSFCKPCIQRVAAPAVPISRSTSFCGIWPSLGSLRRPAPARARAPGLAPVRRASPRRSRRRGRG